MFQGILNRYKNLTSLYYLSSKGSQDSETKYLGCFLDFANLPDLALHLELKLLGSADSLKLALKNSGELSSSVFSHSQKAIFGAIRIACYTGQLLVTLISSSGANPAETRFTSDFLYLWRSKFECEFLSRSSVK